MSRAIFISYRRSDSEGEAGRLSDVLSHRFSEQAVFMDVDAIQPGRDFRKAIEESVQACAVLLTIIGPHWLNAQNAAGERRLDEVNDYVRLEIAAALRRDIPVIPVLVRGGRMPQAEQMPKDLADLAYRNGVELTHARWKSDLRVLIQALEPYMLEPPAEVAPSAAADGVGSHAVLPAAALEKVSRQLAHYIGPIADVMVKRAARQCASTVELAEAVAGEIESAADRQRFLSHFHH